MPLNVFYPQKMTLKSYFPRTIEDESIQWLKKYLDTDIEILTGEEIPNPADYEILIAGRPTIEQIEASPNLKVIIIPWAGLSEQTSRVMEKYPHIKIHNLHHNAVATGETAMMLLFTAAKQIIPIDKKLRDNDWRPRYQPNPALLLEGKTILILGFGSIGQYVGRVCHAMGMNVKAIRRNPKANAAQEYPAAIYSPEKLHQLLSSTDVLMVTVPLTKETHEMIGKTEIDLMPEQSIIINVGRGLVIDQEALYKALKSKKLHSAGIDVWYNYPLDEESRKNTAPADYPFNELNHLVMSPHRGGGAKDVDKLRMRDLAKMLNNAAKGEPLPNLVNIKKGY